MSQPRVLSGIQPTADSLHLGNYLGAVRQWVALQDEADAFYFVADLHAVTVPYDAARLRERTRGTVAQLLALGIDPDRSTLFLQSHLPEHSELEWLLSGLTGYGEAGRMTQFKDKSARGELGSATVGLFTYPVLQAADVLLYHADRVPVGEDQRQHLELTRELARRFNARFGETFTVPEPYILREAAKVLDLQTPEKQMSKSAASDAGIVWLLEDPKRIAKKVRSAVTDSGREIVAAPDKPGVTNLLTILGAFTGRTTGELEEAYAGRGYGDLKRDTADALVAFVEPVQQRTRELLAEPDAIDEILAQGARKARKVAADTLAVAYDRAGFLAAK